MAKKRIVGRYPKAFRTMATERLKSCENIVALSEGLGVFAVHNGELRWLGSIRRRVGRPPVILLDLRSLIQ